MEVGVQRSIIVDSSDFFITDKELVFSAFSAQCNRVSLNRQLLSSGTLFRSGGSEK